VLATNPTLALANAVLFLEAFGHTVIAWIWLRQALAAQRGLQRGITADAAFYRGKLAACRWFYRWELPKVRQWHELLRSLDDTTLGFPPESF
jgi:butyryl-CoA dehydrogenase